MKIKSFLVLLLLILNLRVSSQVDSINIKKNYCWVSLSGQLLSSPRINIMAANSISLTYSYNHKHYFRAKYYKTIGEKDTSSNFHSRPNRITTFECYLLQYGIGKFIKRKTIGVVYAGISYNNGVYRGGINKVNPSYYKTGFLGGYEVPTTYFYNFSAFQNIGIPITASFTRPVFPVAAIGLDFYINISQHTEFGIAINLSLGRIVSRKTFLDSKIKKFKS